MEFKFVDGKFVDAETGEAVSSEDYKTIKQSLGWMSKDEYEKGVSTALNKRAEALAEKKLEDRLNKEMQALRANENASAEEIRVLQEQLDKIEREKMSTEERVKAQFEQDLLERDNRYKKKASEYESLMQEYRDTVATNKLMSLASKHDAIEEDFVALLRQKEQWVEVEDKGTKKEILKYKVPVYNESSQAYEDTLVDAEKAAEVYAQLKPHLIKAKHASGLGGVGTMPGTTGQVRTVDDAYNRFIRKGR